MRTLYLKPKKSRAANTFSSVRDIMAELAGICGTGEEVEVICAPGVYPVYEAMLFTEKSVPVTFKAEKPGGTIFDGGTHITKWTTASCNGRSALCADVPRQCITKNSLPQVFINGKRRNNSPYPKGIDGMLPAEIDKDESIRDRFPLKDKVFKKEWTADKGLQATVIHLWSESHLTVSGFKAESNSVKLTPDIARDVRESSRLFLRNLKEAFTEQGEYYFDLKAGKIYYLPEDGEEEIDCVIPGHFPMVVICGKPEKEKYAECVNFEGIVFRHVGGSRPDFKNHYDLGQKKLPAIPNGFNSYLISRNIEPDIKDDYSQQASIHLPAAVMYHGARNCSLKDCSIEKCGWNGIHYAFGCSDMTVTGCSICDMGGGGIYVSGPGAVLKQPQLNTERITITGNLISKCCRFYLSAVGINIGYARGVLIEHNDIDDLYYSGISAGWVWGYAESATSEIRIGFNHIRNIGQGMLCDMGGIYLLATQPGTRVYNNLIHDIKCRFYGGWGLYTDEGSSYIVLENNICYDCCKESCHQHFGRENIYRFNICALAENAGFNVSDGTRTQKGYNCPGENYRYNVTCINNVILVDDTPFHCSWKKENISEQFFCDMNCYWDISGKMRSFAVEYKRTADGEVFYRTFKDWQKAGHDLHGIIADPGFVNIKKRDFHLKKSSILRKMNFPDPEITLSQAGRTIKDK